jgi:hypothetical protein
MRQQLPSLRRGDFDNFLYSVLREVDGVPLTVLSALARNDLDPWDAADELTRLPRNAAAARLGKLLSYQPNGAGEPPSNDLTTIQLLATLPEAWTVQRQEMPPAWQSLLNSLAKLKALFCAERPPGRRKQ